MKTVYWILFFLLCVILATCAIFWVLNKMVPGSYPKAEVYYVEIPINQSDSIIKNIKEIYPQLQNYKYIYVNQSNHARSEVMDSIKSKDINGFIEFKLPNINYTVLCRIDQLFNQPSISQIRLVYAVSLKNNSVKGEINTSELSEEENKKIKKVFEEEVLSKLGIWKRERFFSFFNFLF